MKFAMHNWMRQEPIETTIERLHRLGYDGIEISGEPTQYDTSHVAGLLEKYQLACWGSHSIMMPGRDLVHEEASVRAETVQYMQACVRMVHELGGSIFVIFPSECNRLSRQATPDQEWGWGVEGVRRIAEYAAERDIRVGIEALNRFETHFINRHDQALALADEVGPEVGVALDAFPHEHRGSRSPAGHTQRGPASDRLPCRRQQPAAAGTGKLRLESGDSDLARGGLRRLPHPGVCQSHRSNPPWRPEGNRLGRSFR